MIIQFLFWYFNINHICKFTLITVHDNIVICLSTTSSSFPVSSGNGRPSKSVTHKRFQLSRCSESSVFLEHIHRRQPGPFLPWVGSHSIRSLTVSSLCLIQCPARRSLLSLFFPSLSVYYRSVPHCWLCLSVTFIAIGNIKV